MDPFMRNFRHYLGAKRGPSQSVLSQKYINLKIYLVKNTAISAKSSSESSIISLSIIYNLLVSLGLIKSLFFLYYKYWAFIGRDRQRFRRIANQRAALLRDSNTVWINGISPRENVSEFAIGVSENWADRRDHSAKNNPRVSTYAFNHSKWKERFP